MKTAFFHLMPYPELPADFPETHRSVWVDIDPKLFDPKVGHRAYNDYIDELEYAAAVGFDGVGINEHHSNGYGLMPSPNIIAASLSRSCPDATIVVLGDSVALYNPPLRVAEELAMLARHLQGVDARTHLLSQVTDGDLRDRTHLRRLRGPSNANANARADVTERTITLRSDDPIARLADATELPAGQIGEIIVRGPTATQSYDALPEHTARAKIADTSALGFESLGFGISTGCSAAAWHRMGDCGYLDDFGRLWFCGRAAERVETPNGPLYTEQIEPVFNQHPGVRRTALIGIGNRPRQRAALVVEPRDPNDIRISAKCRALGRELRELTRKHPHAGRITLFYFHPGFPVDVRHNAKIHRLTLTDWAQNETTGFEIDPKK